MWKISEVNCFRCVSISVCATMHGPSENTHYFDMHRIVHFDFKGAPLQVAYLKQVLICIKHWGATGILIEWEDTFPFVAELVDIGSQRTRHGSGGDGLYSMQEVQQIFDFAKELGLEVIQLIQTMGHMEYVLKHPSFRPLRESMRSSAVLCPSTAEAQALVCALLAQALDAQPDARFVHIGADEVWHLGVCPQCRARSARNRFGASSLFLEHISAVVAFVKHHRPGISVLMWDDMIRSISVEALREYKLDQAVEPVVWHYNPQECFHVDPTLWMVYGQTFPRVWGGSAFKGANGSSMMFSHTMRYATNNFAWREVVRNYAHVANFGGVVITGWSRYDHYATLCEPMMVALPTLKSCLKVLMDTEQQSTESLSCDNLPPEEWPGADVAKCLLDFLAAKERAFAFVHGDQVTSWFNPWQQSKSFICPAQVESVATNAQHFITELTAMDSELSIKLKRITGRRSANELLETHLRPIARQLTELRDKAVVFCTLEPGVNAGQ